MEKIAGQKPIVTVAKKSIANFKVRDDYPVGCKVTLRKSNMYTFLDRLIKLQYLENEILGAYQQNLLMAEAIIIWVLKNK